MIREQVRQRVAEAVDRLKAAGALPKTVDAPVEIVDPKDPAHGDFATSFALAAAKSAGMNPRELAENLAAALQTTNHKPQSTLLRSAEVAGPGFLNFRVADEAWLEGVHWANERAEDLAKPQCPNAPTPNAPTPQRLNVEFVSVNPNGPITVGSGRGAAFGSTLCNVLEAVGHEVHREYYINDGLNSEQMRQFAESVAHYISLEKGETPQHEVSYKGDYVRAVALKMLAEFQGGQSDKEILRKRSEDLMIQSQREDLASFDTCFDTWYSEQSLLSSGEVEKQVQELITEGAADDRPIRHVLKLAKGGVVEDVEIVDQPNEEVDENLHSEGIEGNQRESKDHDQSTNHNPQSTSAKTLWLRSTKFGDDMDRVLRRKDGRLTYIASDVAYHKDKFNRPPNADRLITILGPDHHGYINRLHAVVGALLEKDEELKKKYENAPTPQRPNALNEIESKIYDSPEERDACLAALEESRKKLEVIIFQIVRFVKEGKPAPMRKRDGNIYSLRDLMAEIGKDAAPNASPEEQLKIGKDVARFFYLMRSHDTHMDFDIDLATKGTEENPAFYVQYAHARICSILKKSEESKLSYSSERSDEEEGPGEEKEELHPKESALIKKILDLPEEVLRCAEDYGVHRLTIYAVELARTFHHFYEACRVIQPENPGLTKRRLAICQATQHALKGTLDLLGVSAPERMEREAPEPARS